MVFETRSRTATIDITSSQKHIFKAHQADVVSSLCSRRRLTVPPGQIREREDPLGDGGTEL